MPKKKMPSQKTKPKSPPQSKRTPSKTKDAKNKVNKDINIQNTKDANTQNDTVENQAHQTYLFPTKETDLGEFHLDSLSQRKSKESRNLDLKEAWYCPNEELHNAFRFYSFQHNMKKSNIITKAIVEMLEREGFLKKS